MVMPDAPMMMLIPTTTPNPIMMLNGSCEAVSRVWQHENMFLTAESCRAARYGEDEDAVAMVEDAQDSSMRRGRPFKARRFNELQ